MARAERRPCTDMGPEKYLIAVSVPLALLAVILWFPRKRKVYPMGIGPFTIRQGTAPTFAKLMFAVVGLLLGTAGMLVLLK